MKTLWINAGEISGDVQGGAVLAGLRQHETKADPWRVVGMGGDCLAQAGQENILRVEDLSVMGVVEVLTSLPRIIKLLRRIKRELTRIRPDAVLLIDSPDFNFIVARMAHKLGIPVYYFIPPKIWAWRTGRVKFLQRNIRRVFAILPFEVDFYRTHGVDVTYVGNPLVDLVNRAGIEHITPLPGQIGLMPGSRRREVESLLPAFAKTAELLLPDFPQLSFHAIRAPHFTEDYLRRFWPSSVPLHITAPDNRYAFMRSCQCMMAASGTATLETGLAGVPTLVAYTLNPLSHALALRVVKAPYASLTNLILGREAFPEHLQHNADPALMAARIRGWLTDPSHFARMHADLDQLREICGTPGGASRVGEELLKEMEVS